MDSLTNGRDGRFGLVNIKLSFAFVPFLGAKIDFAGVIPTIIIFRDMGTFAVEGLTTAMSLKSQADWLILVLWDVLFQPTPLPFGKFKTFGRGPNPTLLSLSVSETSEVLAGVDWPERDPEPDAERRELVGMDA